MFGYERGITFANEVYTSRQVPRIDPYFDEIIIAEFPNRATRESFRADVTNAGPRRDSRKAGISDQSHLFSKGEISEAGSDLISFFHSTAQGPTPGKNENISCLDCGLRLAFDRTNRFPFRRKNRTRPIL